MGRFTRLLLPRVSVLCGLWALLVVLQGLPLLQPARWRSLVLGAVEDGFVLAWLEGGHGRVPVRLQTFASDLTPRTAPRRVGHAPATALLSLWSRGDRVRLLMVPAYTTSATDVGIFNHVGRRWPSPRGEPTGWPIAIDTTSEGRVMTLAPDGGPGPHPAGCDWQPRSGAWLHEATSARDAVGRVRATVLSGRRGWEVIPLADLDRGSSVQLRGGHCPYGARPRECVAAAADDRGVVVAWVRDYSLGSELVLSRIGLDGRMDPAHETVLARHQNGPLVASFSALLTILLGLVAHALLRGGGAARLLVALGRPRGRVWLEGRFAEPRDGLVIGGGDAAWRMQTSAAWLDVPSGDRVHVRPGAPFVVTLAALRGELPAQAAAVASFDRAYVAGFLRPSDEGGAYRGGAPTAVEPAVVSDAPLPLVRAALRGTLLCAIVDVVSLGAIASVAIAAAL